MSNRKFQSISLNEKPFVVASLLYDSFVSEPGYQALLMSNSKGYESRLLKALRLLIDIQLKAGGEALGVFEDNEDNIVGVAMLLPDTVSISLMTSRWNRFKLFMAIGPSPAFRLIQYFRHLRDTIPSKSYLVISQLGIVHSARRHGAGTFLLNEVWKHKDKVASKGVFVYSGNKQYDAYLKHLGYVPLKSFNQGRFIEQTYLKTEDFQTTGGEIASR